LNRLGSRFSPKISIFSAACASHKLTNPKDLYSTTGKTMLIRRKKAPLKQGEEPNMTSHPDPGKKSKKKGGIWPLRRRSSFKRSSSRFGAAPAEDELIQTVDSLSSSKVSPQVKVIYDKFSDDPHAVLKVQCDDDEYQELMMSEDDQVVVQVEVRCDERWLSLAKI
jgi:hypothetical protein